MQDIWVYIVFIERYKFDEVITYNEIKGEPECIWAQKSFSDFQVTSVPNQYQTTLELQKP